MKRKIFTTALLAGCFMVCLAAIADLTGKWTGVLNMNDGSQYPMVYKLKADGDKLTGTALTPDGEVAITNGKISGTDFSFSISTSGMDIPNTGKFYGDSIGVDLEIQGSKVHTVLKRADK